MGLVKEVSIMQMALCVYCGASEQVDHIYRQASVDLGESIAKKGYKLVYGGGRLGLMGLVSSTVLKHSGLVIGITTNHLDQREGAQTGLSELHIVDTMYERKSRMAERADAFIIMPGGYGTLDEFFDTLTCKQLNFHKKPIIIVNINKYWDPLIHLLKHVINDKFAHAEHHFMINVANSVENIFEILNTVKCNENH